MVKQEEKQRLYAQRAPVAHLLLSVHIQLHSWLPALLTTSRPKFTTRHLTEPCPRDRFHRDIVDASPLANAPVFCPAYIVSDFLVVYGWENDFHDSNPLWADTEVPYSVIYIWFSGAQTLAIFMGTLGLGSYTMWYCSKSGPHEHTALASGTH